MSKSSLSIFFETVLMIKNGQRRASIVIDVLYRYLNQNKKMSGAWNEIAPDIKLIYQAATPAQASPEPASFSLAVD